MAVTIYNVAKGRGVTIGDSVAIPEPFMTYQTFSYKDYVGISIKIILIYWK